MIQSRDWVNYKGQRVQVIKVYPNSYRVQIDLKGSTKTVNYCELTKAVNTYTPKLTNEQMKQRFLIEIEKVKEAFCSSSTPQAEGGRIALDKLKNKILTGNYE